MAESTILWQMLPAARSKFEASDQTRRPMAPPSDAHSFQRCAPSQFPSNDEVRGHTLERKRAIRLKQLRSMPLACHGIMMPSPSKLEWMHYSHRAVDISA